MNQFRNDMFGRPADEPLLGRKRPRSRGASALSEIAVTREEARRADSRADDRHRLSAQRVTIIYKRKKLEVELINLSGGGAMIAGAIEPRLWQRIDMDFGDTGRLEAVVRWVKDGRIGLEFAHETQIDCSSEQRDMLLRDVLDRNFSEAPAPAAAPAPGPASNGDCVAAQDFDSRRSAPRHPLIWSGNVVLNGRRAKVRIRNISATGALIQSDLTLTPGVLVLLDLGAGGSMTANVAWAFGDKAGLLFDGAFDVQRLAASRPEVAAAEWLCPDYLRSDSDDVSPNAAWQRASVEELASSLESCRKA